MTVTRYHCDIDEHGFNTMTPDIDGAYVAFEDYDKLRDEAEMHYRDLLDALALCAAAEEYKAGRISCWDFWQSINTWKAKVVE